MARSRYRKTQASALIDGLGGESARWTKDAASFSDQKKRLIGDCAVGCAFVSYCGPFNQKYREYLVDEKFTADCESRGVLVTRLYMDERGRCCNAEICKKQWKYVS